jgi:hypothetical protein
MLSFYLLYIQKQLPGIMILKDALRIIIPPHLMGYNIKYNRKIIGPEDLKELIIHYI